MIVGVRLDERLLHGQTMTNWIGLLNASHIVIACDEVANDKLQSASLKMVVPTNLKCSISTVEKAAQILNDPRAKKLRIFVLCRTPQDLLALVKKVPEIQEVNLAAYGFLVKTNVKNKKNIIPCFLAADDDDYEAMKQIKALNIRCYSQVVPSQSMKELNFE